MTAGGGNMKVAKAYNNVIEPYFFDISLDVLKCYYFEQNRFAYLDCIYHSEYSIVSGHCSVMLAVN